MQMQLLFILIMALLLMVFTFQNPYPVQMRFMGWQSGQIPLIMVILISVIMGVVVSLLLGLKQAKELKRNIRQLETELDELKTPPVKSGEEL
jgi:putative membrane protein